MKKTHLIAIIVIALAIGAIMSTISDSSTYADFSTAFAHPGSEYHVVGKYNKEKGSEYHPETNADLFTFYMEDNTGTEKKVWLNKPKPQDFERSEQVVLIGSAKGEHFEATDILMKCPSKYNDGTPGEEHTETTSN